VYVIREVLNCRPGKVRELAAKFRVISSALQESGRPSLRLLTDLSGERFWTLVVEAQVETVDEFLALEQSLMANESVRSAMAGYHDIIERGRREIYRIEA